MKFEDWIGFLITFGVFVYMVIRGAFHNQAQQEGIEEQLPLPPPSPPPPMIKIKKKKAPSIVSQHFEEIAPYEVLGKSAPSKASRLLHSLKSKKEMVILKEIMDPPKGLR